MTEFNIRGAPGLKSVKDMPVKQDMAPPGGYPSVRFARRIINTGPTGATVFAAIGVMMTYGFYQARARSGGATTGGASGGATGGASAREEGGSVCMAES